MGSLVLVAAHEDAETEDQVIVTDPPAAIALLLTDSTGAPPGNWFNAPTA
jgi:hypothetical protein